MFAMIQEERVALTGFGIYRLTRQSFHQKG